MTAIIRVDKDVCLGSGQCARMAPATFTTDEDGLVELVNGGAAADVPDRTVEEIRAAAQSCPAAALILDETIPPAEAGQPTERSTQRSEQ